MPDKKCPVSKLSNVKKQAVKLKFGSRLIRNWNGKTYTVSVIEEGFQPSKGLIYDQAERQDTRPKTYVCKRGCEWGDVTAYNRRIIGA